MKEKAIIDKSGIDRRRFIGGSAAAVSTAVFMTSSAHAENGEKKEFSGPKIRLGMIGCGKRGSWIADLFMKHGGYEIVGAADYFEDAVNMFGDKFGIKQEHRYSALSCYRRLLERSDVDAVAIESPPYFHPEQAAAAVDSGRHVYVAKPVAVDVPGCLSIEESGKKASKKKLCFQVDFQTRADPLYCEAVQRVHNGDIGEFAFGESSYHANRLGLKVEPDGTQEARLRNWSFDKALSGDIITEQNIHTLDVMSWIMNEPPLFAAGTGGRKVRTDVGDCWDHFALLFQYSNNVGITFSSRQFEGYDAEGGIRNRMFGSLGVFEGQYGGTVMIRGQKTYRGGRTSQIYEQGAVNNIAAFYKNITEQKFENPTVAPSVRSNLVTILGRTAAYTGEKVMWDKLVKSTDKIDGRLDGLRA